MWRSSDKRWETPYALFCGVSKKGQESPVRLLCGVCKYVHQEIRIRQIPFVGVVGRFRWWHQMLASRCLLCDIPYQPQIHPRNSTLGWPKEFEEKQWGTIALTLRINAQQVRIQRLSSTSAFLVVWAFIRIITTSSHPNTLGWSDALLLPPPRWCPTLIIAARISTFSPSPPLR